MSSVVPSGAGVAPTGSRADPLQASLAKAADAQVARIVAMVDAMPHRGSADALIAPLRSRLAKLELARRPGFTRLLFDPINPLIMPAKLWRRGRDIGIPRSVLMPMSNALRGMLPALVAEIDQALATIVPGDDAALARVGEQLWPAAAVAIDDMPMPDGWADAAGLMYNDYLGLARTIAAVLHEATEIERLATGKRAPTDEAVRAVLVRSHQRGPVAFAAVLTVLLARMPAPDRVMILASELGRGASLECADQVSAHLLTRLQDRIEAIGTAESPDVTATSVEVAGTAIMLRALDEGKNMPPDHRRRVEQIRSDTDLLCRRRFEQAMQAMMAQQNAAVVEPPNDGVIADLEARARDLRRLEAAGRLLGSAACYDALLRQAILSLRSPGAGLTVAERARLTEILAGPEEALTLMGSGA